MIKGLHGDYRGLSSAAWTPQFVGYNSLLTVYSSQVYVIILRPGYDTKDRGLSSLKFHLTHISNSLVFAGWASEADNGVRSVFGWMEDGRTEWIH